ncbi:unnamed protein product [Nesidiocoris tenuis]|uniref:Uncharacterized protein n=1 Tax=Nesidiocoris tenuis TaxID=355587 RepID=A0A6H5HCH7_9HEMI|nr:unnamed protein product [Nesidiocoris tenuis]
MAMKNKGTRANPKDVSSKAGPGGKQFIRDYSPRKSYYLDSERDFTGPATGSFRRITFFANDKIEIDKPEMNEQDGASCQHEHSSARNLKKYRESKEIWPCLYYAHRRTDIRDTGVGGLGIGGVGGDGAPRGMRHRQQSNPRHPLPAIPHCNFCTYHCNLLHAVYEVLRSKKLSLNTYFEKQDRTCCVRSTMFRPTSYLVRGYSSKCKASRCPGPRKFEFFDRSGP